MELRREFTISMGLLALLNLVLAFGAVGLLTRMWPAIELIMKENVYSIDAAEEILIELSVADIETDSEGARGRALKALQRAEQNVTEDGETIILSAIKENLPLAFSGRADSKQQLLADVHELIRINRGAMERVSVEAERLSTAGAWAAVFAGVLSFILTLFIVARLQRRFAIPLADLHRVLRGALGGDRHRRCHAFQGPAELVEISRSVNKLLDERQPSPTLDD